MKYILFSLLLGIGLIIPQNSFAQTADAVCSGKKMEMPVDLLPRYSLVEGVHLLEVHNLDFVIELMGMILQLIIP